MAHLATLQRIHLPQFAEDEDAWLVYVGDGFGAVASKTPSIDLEDQFAKALMRCQQTGDLFVYVLSTGALSSLTSKRGQYTETALDVKHGRVGAVSKHQCYMLELPRDGFRLFWHCFNIYSLLQLK